MIRYRKKIIITIFTLAIISIWLVGFIHINNRFPKSVLEEYHTNQWLNYENSKLMPIQLDIYSGSQFADTYSDIGKPFANQNCKIIVTKIKIKNNSNDKVDVMKYFTRFDLVAYPIGFENQGLLVDMNDLYVAPDEEKEVSAYYMVMQGLVSNSKMDEFLKCKFNMGIRLYPVKQVLVFDNIIIH